MQDKELHEPRAEVEKLRQENERLQKLTTDEDKVEAAPESLPAGVRIEAAVIMGPSAAETTGEADPVAEVGVAGDELPAVVHVQTVPVVEPTANGADASTSAAEVAPTQLDVDDEEEEAYVWTEGGITALEQVPHVYIEAG